LRLARSLPTSSSLAGSKRLVVLSEPGSNAGTVVVSMHRSSCAIENSPSTGSRFPRRFVFIVGSGHSGSTVPATILGAHPEILALSEIAFFDHWIELNQLCNCGVPVRSCPRWSKVVDRLSAKRALSPTDFADEFAIDLSTIFDRTLPPQRLAHLESQSSPCGPSRSPYGFKWLACRLGRHYSSELAMPLSFMTLHMRLADGPLWSTLRRVSTVS
jgi:hypothetical protein